MASHGHSRYASPPSRSFRSPSPSRRYERSPSPKYCLNVMNSEWKYQTRSIFVGNIPYTFRWKDLDDLFRPFGPLEDTSVPLDHRLNHNKGDAERAMHELGAKRLGGRTLRLDWDPGTSRKLNMFRGAPSGRPDHPPHSRYSRSPSSGRPDHAPNPRYSRSPRIESRHHYSPYRHVRSNHL